MADLAVIRSAAVVLGLEVDDRELRGFGTRTLGALDRGAGVPIRQQHEKGRTQGSTGPRGH